jgi:hypothetical protein
MTSRQDFAPRNAHTVCHGQDNGELVPREFHLKTTDG